MHKYRLGQKKKINETQFEVHKKKYNSILHVTKQKEKKLINESSSIKLKLSVISSAK